MNGPTPDLVITDPSDYMDPKERDIRKKLREAAPKIQCLDSGFIVDNIIGRQLYEWILYGHSIKTFPYDLEDPTLTDIKATLWCIGHHPTVHSYIESDIKNFRKVVPSFMYDVKFRIDFNGYGHIRLIEHSAALYIMLYRSGLMNDDDIWNPCSPKRQRDKEFMYEVVKYATGFDDPEFFDDILRSEPTNYALFGDKTKVDSMLETIKYQTELKAVFLRFLHDHLKPEEEKMRL